MAMPETTTEVPQDFEALKAAILERKAELPKRLRQVAAYSLDNPDEIAFGTAASIATSAEVQPSTLVRFAREAATNIVKHAGSPRTVVFRLTFSRDTVTLRITNTPFRSALPALSSSGFGLARLRERAALLGGSFEAGIEGGLWAVRMTLPQR